MIKTSHSITQKKKTSTKLINQGTLDYLVKPVNHINFIEKKNYKAKLSTIQILKNKINKKNFEKKIHNKNLIKKTKGKGKKPRVQDIALKLGLTSQHGIETRPCLRKNKGM
jgi:response regulator of citrate/malate metabolism